MFIGLLFFNLFIWHQTFSQRQNFLKISFLDVGKGDSIFLEFPKGGTMLIDGGEGLGVDMGKWVVTRFLGANGINKIDVVVATHPHTDHIGGLLAILKNFKVKVFIENGDAQSNPLYLESQELIRQKRIKRFIVKEGDYIKGFNDIDLYVLNPPIKKFYDLNNNSLVFKLRYRNFAALFCADIKRDAAKNLLSNQDEKLVSTALKIPHHGGDLGDVASEFLEKINPEAAIISTADRKINSSILLILNKLRTRVYRTDLNGAIFLTTDGNGYSIDAYKK